MTTKARINEICKQAGFTEEQIDQLAAAIESSEFKWNTSVIIALIVNMFKDPKFYANTIAYEHFEFSIDRDNYVKSNAMKVGSEPYSYLMKIIYCIAKGNKRKMARALFIERMDELGRDANLPLFDDIAEKLPVDCKL